MEEIDLKECWKRGLLKEIETNKWLIEKSIQIAEQKLQDAEKSFLADVYNGAVFFAYMVMFHAAKAILFRDGIREKSHRCVVLYLKEIYGKQGEISLHLVHSLDSHRIERHDIVYGFDFIATKEDAEIAVEDAKDFLKSARKILKIKNKK